MNSNNNFKNFKQIVENTRATRRFKQNISIDTKDLSDLIDLTRTTSSSKNMQPLKYIIINGNDDEAIKEEIYKPLKWAAHLSDWDQSENEKPSSYILILNDTSIDGMPMIDVGIALQTIMLGLSSMGLNGCPLASIDKIAYKKLFKLSDNLEPFLIIAIGKSDEDIILVDAKDDTNYYRDEKQNHFVPKRTLEDVLVIVK